MPIQDGQITESRRFLRKPVVILCLVALLGVCAYVTYDRYNERLQTAVETEVWETALITSSELDMAEASEHFSQLAAAEGDAVLRARYTILAGMSMNAARDYGRGIPLLKGVVADQALPNEIKAEALLALLNVYYSGEMEPLQMIFNDGGIYAAALSGGDIADPVVLGRAVRNLYQTVDEYHQYAFTQYALTVGPVLYLTNTPDAPESEVERALTAIQDMLDRGDLLLQDELAAGLYEENSISVVRNFLLMSTHLRLRALETLALFDESKRAEVDEYYAYALEVFAEDDYLAARSIEAYLRFYYAAYLVEVYGEMRASDIQLALGPLTDEMGTWGESNKYSVWPFFERELSRPDGNETSDTIRIRAVAAADPEFAVFLSERGLLSE